MEDMLKKFLEETTAEVDKKIKTAELASACVELHMMYKHLRDAGFTNAQAMELVKHILSMAIATALKKE